MLLLSVQSAAAALTRTPSALPIPNWAVRKADFDDSAGRVPRAGNATQCNHEPRGTYIVVVPEIRLPVCQNEDARCVTAVPRITDFLPSNLVALPPMQWQSL